MVLGEVGKSGLRLRRGESFNPPDSGAFLLLSESLDAKDADGRLPLLEEAAEVMGDLLFEYG
jgi:hypothetical protein